MTCRNYPRCRYYCAVTESCDYFLETGLRRPVKPPDCPGYPIPEERRQSGLLLPHSLLFDRHTGELRGRVHV